MNFQKIYFLSCLKKCAFLKFANNLQTKGGYDLLKLYLQTFFRESERTVDNILFSGFSDSVIVQLQKHGFAFRFPIHK